MRCVNVEDANIAWFTAAPQLAFSRAPCLLRTRPGASAVAKSPVLLELWPCLADGTALKLRRLMRTYRSHADLEICNDYGCLRATVQAAESRGALQSLHTPSCGGLEERRKTGSGRSYEANAPRCYDTMASRLFSTRDSTVVSLRGAQRA